MINLNSVKYDRIKSCGCGREIGVEKHGLSRTRIYKMHQQMIQRCYNPNVPKYNIWGGRGIRVCDEWLKPPPQGFLNFYEWAMSHGYTDELSIDRIDVNGNYCPENCRFATVQEQNYNRRDTIRYDDAGETLLDLYRNYANPEIDYESLKSRFDKTLHTYDDWSMNDKLNIPPRKHMKEYRRSHHIIDPIYFVNNKGNKGGK